MSTLFFDTGNLGADPVVRDAPVDGGTTRVINMSVYIDNPKKTDEGYKDQGGYWVDVSLFGPRADTLGKQLKKGARVCVYGQMHMEQYQHEGADRTAIKVIASFIGPDPIAIESITFRKGSNAVAGAEQDAA